MPPLRFGQPDGYDHLPGLWCESHGSDTASGERPATDNHRHPAKTCIRAVSAGSATYARTNGSGSCRPHSDR